MESGPLYIKNGITIRYTVGKWAIEEYVLKLANPFICGDYCKLRHIIHQSLNTIIGMVENV